MKQHFTKAEKEAYKMKQAHIKAAQEQFDKQVSYPEIGLLIKR